MNSFKKKSGMEVKPILKDKDKEDKGRALQLVPEYVDKKAYNQGNMNPNYVCAGSLYIPRDIIQIVNANDAGAAKIYMGPVRDGGNVFNSDEESVSIEDPDVRKYINRILRYFKYDPEEAMTTLREASFKIKNRARGVVKRSYSQNAVSKLNTWRAQVQYSEGESDEEMEHEPHHIVQNVPLTQEEDKDDYSYDGEFEEVDKRSFIHKTFNKIFSTKSTTKIDKISKEISFSETPGSSEGERSLRKKEKAKKSKSLSQLINEGNKQVTGFLPSVTTDPEEKKENFKKIEIPNLNKIISNNIKKLIIALKNICHIKSKFDNKAANNPTNFIYSDMYLNYQGASIEKKLLKWESSPSRQDELLLSYLTAPRFHNCDTYTVILINTENSQNLRSHNRKRALKKMKNRLRRLETGPRELEQAYPCSIYDEMARRENVLPFNKLLPNQGRFVCSNPCFERYQEFDSRTVHNTRHCAEVARQSVDIIADTFVNLIDSPDDPKCKVEITGQGYKGKFNVGLDPIIDEVLYNSLLNLKETYENAKCYYPTKRRRRTFSNIADNVRSYLCKVAGRNSFRESGIRFSSENVLGRTSVYRGETDNYEEDRPEITYEDLDIKQRKCQPKDKRTCASLGKISRYFIDNEKFKSRSKYNKRNNVRRARRRTNINSSESDSFEEKQFVRSAKKSFPPISSDESFVQRETSSTIDESMSNKYGSTRNNENKKGSFNSRDVKKQGYSPNLSYISEKDWKAADEMLINEKEVDNNLIGQKEVVKMKETMTTTTNGVTTVTQTEIIKAINQSSQCIIPSPSKDELVGKREFNVLPTLHNDTKREQSGGRLVNMSRNLQGHRDPSEEITVPYKKGINREMFSHKNIEKSQKMDYLQNRCPRKYRCYEDAEEKNYLNSTISKENLGLPDPKKNYEYNGTFITHYAENHSPKDLQKCSWRKGKCHCSPIGIKNNRLSNEMLKMTQSPETNDLKNPRRKVLGVHKVHSDPINTYHTKSYLTNSPKDGKEMYVKINALTEIEREHRYMRYKQNLKDRTHFKESEKQESQPPEEVILTENGNTKIRISLGSCDKTQRQQAFLELMEALKRKLDSENQFITGNTPLHKVNLDNLDDHRSVKGSQPMQAHKTSINNNKTEKGVIKEMNKTATVAMMSPTKERTCDRLPLCTGPLNKMRIVTNKRNAKTSCHRPCFCDEKRKNIARKPVAENDISTKRKSSELLLLKNKDIEKPKTASISVQTDNLVKPTTSKQTKVQKSKESLLIASASSQTDDLNETISPQSSVILPSGKRSSRESRPRIKTGSLFSKPLSEKNSLEASRWRQSGSGKSSIRKSRKKGSDRKSSRKETVRSSQGTLFIRRSTLPLVEKKKQKRRPRRSSMINQRVWIQNLKVPSKYSHQTVPNDKKEKIMKPLKASASHKLTEASNIYYHNNETDNCSVNSTPKKNSRKSNKTSRKRKMTFLSVPHNSENSILSIPGNQKTSIMYCAPKERKKEKFIVAPIRKKSCKSRMIESMPLVPYRKSSSLIKIIGDPDSVENNSSKFISDTPSLYSEKSISSIILLSDSTSSIISKYAKESVISLNSQEKSSCSLLSYEESPSFSEYVENFQPHSSLTTARSDNWKNNSTGNKHIKRVVRIPKPQPLVKSITTEKKKKNCNIWPDNCDSICLQCFSETSEAFEIVPDSPKTRKEDVMNAQPSHSSPNAVSSTSRGFSRQKSSSSGSSDSKTTVISGPIVYKKQLAMRLQNFMTKPSTVNSSGSNKSSVSSKQKRSSVESTVGSERNDSLKSKFKRCHPIMRKIQLGLNKVKNRSNDETASSDDMELSDDSSSKAYCNMLEFDKYSTEPSTSQKSNEQSSNDTDVPEVIVHTMTSKRCKCKMMAGTVKLKKHDRKAKKGTKLISTNDYNINSTLCINDDQAQPAENEESDEVNCTTIGYDRSNVTLRKENRKVSKCYKFRAMDGTVCSSTGWIVNSSDSDLEPSGSNTDKLHKRSKNIERSPKKNNTKYLMLATDLRKSSSELLEKKRSPRRTFIRRTIINDDEFEPNERRNKDTHSSSRGKKKSYHKEPDDRLCN